jgi:hypothetical protein
MQILLGGFVALMAFSLCRKNGIGLTRSFLRSYGLAAVVWIIGDLFFGRVVFFHYF